MVSQSLITLKAIFFHNTLHQSPSIYYLYLWIIFLLVNTTSHTVQFIVDYHRKGTAITIDISSSYLFFVITIMFIITFKKLNKIWPPIREIIGSFTFLSQVFVVSEMYYRFEKNKNTFLLSYVALTFNSVLIFNESAPNAIKALTYQTLLFFYSIASYSYRLSSVGDIMIHRKMLQWYSFIYAIALFNTYYLMKLRYENMHKILTLEETIKSWRKVMDLSGIGISIESGQKVLYRNTRFTNIHQEIENHKGSEASKELALNLPNSIEKGLILNEKPGFKVNQMRIYFDNTKSNAYLIKDIKKVKQLSYFHLLIATITHELRTPLNIIIAILGLLSEKIVNEEIKEDISKALCATLLQETLINDILDLAKLSNGELKVSSTPTKIKQSLEYLHDLFKYRVDKQIIFTLVIRPGTPEWLSIDERRYKQVVLNLLSNSSKFTSHGFIKIESYFEGGYLYTSVSDSGIGINGVDRDKIFGKFGMVDNAANKSGTGLGLNLCKVLVEKMGGHIYFESIPNIKTEFTFTIKAEQWYDNIIIEKKKVCYEKVLIVDDNIMNVEVLKSFCQKKGLMFNAYCDSKKAYDSICVQQHCLFIGFLDLQMPGMDGYALASALKASDCNCYLIAVTGEDKQSVVQKCKQAGFDDVVEKPISFELFNQLI